MENGSTKKATLLILRLLHRKCKTKSLIGHKYCVRHEKRKIFSVGQVELQMSHTIHEILNVLEGSLHVILY